MKQSMPQKGQKKSLNRTSAINPIRTLTDLSETSIDVFLKRDHSTVHVSIKRSGIRSGQTRNLLKEWMNGSKNMSH